MTEREAKERFRTMSHAQLGKFGEAFWKKAFVSSEMRYIPLCNIEDGGAPLAKGANGFILPDFEIQGRGGTAYVDSKVKSHPVLFRKTNQLRHGIDRKNWEAYKKAGIAGNKSCGLAIVELFRDEENKDWSGQLLVESFSGLGFPTVGTSTQAHMVYWSWKQFENLGLLFASELFAVVNGEMSVSFRSELESVFMRDAAPAQVSSESNRLF